MFFKQDGKNAHFKRTGGWGGRRQPSYPCVCVYTYKYVCIYTYIPYICIYLHTYLYIHTYSIYTYKLHSYIHTFFCLDFHLTNEQSISLVSNRNQKRPQAKQSDTMETSPNGLARRSRKPDHSQSVLPQERKTSRMIK